ncbi:hypothetical protein BdWA1_003175 [Babesia duncani]|uniref:Uncharacterized protein n=1 Tax=Babesia duncani TaxID=323732 RepID=A0AAD9PIU2_9APIC|nr:hypothetical protein BdWA1_003175 [Babesia duncani]
MFKRFTAVEYSKIPVPVPNRLNAKKVTLYKFKSMDLLKIPNSKPSVENRKYTKYLHFKKLGNKWQPLNLREFTYLFNTESMQAAILDMTGTDENIKVSMKKRDTKYYKPISKNVFVTKVTEGTHYIWPQDDQKGGIFLSASSKQKKNGQTHLHIKYKDIDKKKKDSYYMSDGSKWSRLEKRRGKPLYIELQNPQNLENRGNNSPPEEEERPAEDEEDVSAEEERPAEDEEGGQFIEINQAKESEHPSFLNMKTTDTSSRTRKSKAKSPRKNTYSDDDNDEGDDDNGKQGNDDNDEGDDDNGKQGNDDNDEGDEDTYNNERKNNFKHRTSSRKGRLGKQEKRGKIKTLFSRKRRDKKGYGVKKPTGRKFFRRAFSRTRA